jgi:hypothetical protein
MPETSPPPRWALTPPFHPCLIPKAMKTLGPSAVCFLLRCPWACARWALPTTLPYEARTFLEACASRQPCPHGRARSSHAARDSQWPRRPRGADPRARRLDRVRLRKEPMHTGDSVKRFAEREDRLDPVPPHDRDVVRAARGDPSIHGRNRSAHRRRIATRLPASAVGFRTITPVRPTRSSSASPRQLVPVHSGVVADSSVSEGAQKAVRARSQSRLPIRGLFVVVPPVPKLLRPRQLTLSGERLQCLAQRAAENLPVVFRLRGRELVLGPAALL